MKNFMVKLGIGMVLLGAIAATSCTNRSYPCPAYTKGQSPNPNVAMVVDPDGMPVSTMRVKKDKNGLVTKKKIARIRNK
jgi:hypothetical protein